MNDVHTFAEFLQHPLLPLHYFQHALLVVLQQSKFFFLFLVQEIDENPLRKQPKFHRFLNLYKSGYERISRDYEMYEKGR